MTYIRAVSIKDFFRSILFMENNFYRLLFSLSALSVHVKFGKLLCDKGHKHHINNFRCGPSLLIAQCPTLLAHPVYTSSFPNPQKR